MQRRSVAGGRRGLAVVVLALALVAAACGGGGAQQEHKGEDPHEKRVPDAQVAAGLREIDGLARQAGEKAGSDKAGAEKAAEDIHHQWEEIEGTIKANDQDSYLAFEDNFALLESAVDTNDAGKARTAAGTISETANKYLAKHPG